MHLMENNSKLVLMYLCSLVLGFPCTAVPKPDHSRVQEKASNT